MTPVHGPIKITNLTVKYLINIQYYYYRGSYVIHECVFVFNRHVNASSATPKSTINIDLGTSTKHRPAVCGVPARLLFSSRRGRNVRMTLPRPKKNEFYTPWETQSEIISGSTDSTKTIERTFQLNKIKTWKNGKLSTFAASKVSIDYKNNCMQNKNLKLYQNYINLPYICEIVDFTTVQVLAVAGSSRCPLKPPPPLRASMRPFLERICRCWAWGGQQILAG